jgi:hypothetical protein
MYRKGLGVKFQFEYCWNLLKTMPKWNLLKTVTRRNSIPTSNYFEAVINRGEDNDDENVIVNLERPIGKKAAKEREREKKKKKAKIVERKGL